MYLDSDTALEAGSIDSAVKGFNGILKVQAQNGVCSPVPLNKGIFAQYKALVEASWADDIDNWDSSSACINARVGVFTKASLNEAGGFNENYPDASVEDHEFGIRYSKKYRIYTNKDIIARHKFPGFKKTVINYWDRTYKMMQLANKHKDALKTGGVSVRSALQYLMCPLFLLLLPFALLFPIVWFLWLAATVVFMVTSINVIKRLFSKGPFFGIFGIVIHAVYGVVITLSALKFYLKLLLKR